MPTEEEEEALQQALPLLLAAISEEASLTGGLGGAPQGW